MVKKSDRVFYRNIENKFNLFNEKFWPYVNKKSENECWGWNGYTNNLGYGKIYSDRIYVYSHRLSYILYKGKIPNGKEICHTCNNPNCVNPNRLEAKSHKENIQQVTKDKRWLKMDHRGEKNTGVKLKATDVAIIREQYNSKKYSAMELSKIYRVTPEHIWAITAYKRWNY